MKIDSTGNCFAILKGNKKKVVNNCTTRLINAFKNKIGGIHKFLLNYANDYLCKELKLSWWNKLN